MKPKIKTDRQARIATVRSERLHTDAIIATTVPIMAVTRLPVELKIRGKVIADKTA